MALFSVRNRVVQRRKRRREQASAKGNIPLELVVPGVDLRRVGCSVWGRLKAEQDHCVLEKERRFFNGRERVGRVNGQ